MVTPTSKSELLQALASEDGWTATVAASLLSKNGWLQDGSLRGHELVKANLYEALLSQGDFTETNLSKACLQGADFTNAKLTKARCQGANLKYAMLYEVDCHEAIFDEADLTDARFIACNSIKASFKNAVLVEAILDGRFQQATFVGSNLQKANISADLRGADLSNANFQGAILEGSIFDADTILPDGSNWSSRVDMKRFTIRETR